MDIDELLAKHRPPWSECPPDRHAVEYNCTRGDCELEHIAVMAVNAYAELNAENAKLRKCVGHADRMLECTIDEPDFDEHRAAYDAVRKELP